MKRRRSSLSIVLALLLVSLAAHAQVRPADAADPAMLNRIWLEGTNNSRVMEHLSWITDVFGPRIPGSPAYDKAAEWAVRRFTELGLANAAIEPSGRAWPGLVLRIRFGPHDGPLVYADPGLPPAVDGQH